MDPQRRQYLIQLARLKKEKSRRLARKSLYHFTRFMWDVIEPETPYIDGWHIKSICDHLESVTEFEIKRLMINISPRHTKSILACVMWPAWVWGKYPNRSFIFGSHSLSLAQRDSIKTRQLIESDKYKSVFKPDWELREDQNTLTQFTNTKGGSRRAASVGSTITGSGASYLLTDDPHDVGEIYSELHRERVKFWFDKTLSTRVDHPEYHAKVVIMQRLHEDDLAGHLLKRGDYDTLILPAEYNPDQEIVSKTKLDFKDPRTTPGELLWPEFWTKASLQELKKILGEDAEAQINQTPKAQDGGLFKTHDWKTYHAFPSDIQSIGLFMDCAQKPGISNDYSVFAVWAKTQSGYYLLDLMREKTDAPLLEALTLDMAQRWKPDFLLIEDKSAGSSLIQYLRRETTLPVLAYEPGKRDKIVRATAAVPTIRAGKCFLPKEIKGTENGEAVNLIDIFIKEHETFPRAKHDDLVDTTSMMVEYFNKHGEPNAPLILQL